MCVEHHFDSSCQRQGLWLAGTVSLEYSRERRARLRERREHDRELAGVEFRVYHHCCYCREWFQLLNFVDIVLFS